MQTRFVGTDKPPKQENLLRGTNHSKIGFVFSVALLEVLPGRGVHVDGRRQMRGNRRRFIYQDACS